MWLSGIPYLNMILLTHTDIHTHSRVGSGHDEAGAVGRHGFGAVFVSSVVFLLLLLLFALLLVCVGILVHCDGDGGDRQTDTNGSALPEK